MCEGADQKTLKGHIMSVSLHEMQNYLRAMQCNPETVMNLALLADYNATLYDPVSHNLNYGIQVVKQNTINPQLDFTSVEGKEAVSGLIKRMTIRNEQLSDYMQIKAPLLEMLQDVFEERIKIHEIIPAINKAVDLSLNEWAEKSFDL